MKNKKMEMTKEEFILFCKGLKKEKKLKGCHHVINAWIAQQNSSRKFDVWLNDGKVPEKMSIDIHGLIYELDLFCDVRMGVTVNNVVFKPRSKWQKRKESFYHLIAYVFGLPVYYDEDNNMSIFEKSA